MNDLARRLAALSTLSPTELRTEWRRVLRAPPPALSPDLLRRGIAYRLQEIAHGGLTSAVSRELGQIIRRIARGDAPLGAAAMRLKPGTRLLRDWQGKTYIVMVGDNGFIFNDRLFLSLSPIAREITGTPWSGPRFFGLLAKRADSCRETVDG